ncbi:Nuclear transport factor 2 domain-containing protein [Giardia muris]|uniref:Nuclear transport factor 2 domain-containing protein n=1 Tax=Giardia muris TaxID=5742 RepID=A0A4Z1SZC9_GIAMU|nr:Nuclear transport factor 2 domain-containing protein [Giardia muris]|eukprot:TNJ27013.1 Nuclear transport factor 2 domain-containing protein [Giardia muris]
MQICTPLDVDTTAKMFAQSYYYLLSQGPSKDLTQLLEKTIGAQKARPEDFSFQIAGKIFKSVQDVVAHHQAHTCADSARLVVTSVISAPTYPACVEASLGYHHVLVSGDVIQRDDSKRPFTSTLILGLDRGANGFITFCTICKELFILL